MVATVAREQAPADAVHHPDIQQPPTTPPWLEVPPRVEDPAAERRRQARELIALADGDRDPLEELKASA